MRLSLRVLAPVALLSALVTCTPLTITKGGPEPDALSKGTGDKLGVREEFRHLWSKRSRLFHAARSGDVRSLKKHLRAGASVNAENEHGDTLLLEAVGSGSLSTVRLLLDAGAKVDDSSIGQAGWLGYSKILATLIAKGGNPDAALLSAARGGNLEIVRSLIDERGASLESRSNDGDTPLHLAALQGGIETVRFLLLKGADPTAINAREETALHMAVKGSGKTELIDLLVRAGARLDAPDADGVTPIRRAALSGDRRAYEWLLAESGGSEPPIAPSANASDSAISALFEDLSSLDEDARSAAKRRLAGLGSPVISEIRQRIDKGGSPFDYLELLETLGPSAVEVLPAFVPLLGEGETSGPAFVAMERISPGSFAKLPKTTRMAAARSLKGHIASRRHPNDLSGMYEAVLAEMKRTL